MRSTVGLKPPPPWLCFSEKRSRVEVGSGCSGKSPSGLKMSVSRARASALLFLGSRFQVYHAPWLVNSPRGSVFAARPTPPGLDPRTRPTRTSNAGGLSMNERAQRKYPYL